MRAISLTYIIIHVTVFFCLFEDACQWRRQMGGGDLGVIIPSRILPNAKKCILLRKKKPNRGTGAEKFKIGHDLS